MQTDGEIGKNRPVDPWAVELFPHVYAIGSLSAASGQGSRFPLYLRFYLDCKLLSEHVDKGLIVGKWEPSKKLSHAIIAFDPNKGGMPVRKESRLVGPNNTYEPSWSSVIRTDWIQQKDKTWVPDRIMTSAVSGKTKIELEHQFRWLEKESFHKRLDKANLQELHASSKLNWLDWFEEAFGIEPVKPSLGRITK